MRAFVLGGTRFIGRHTVAHLLDRGDDVTLFTRGRSGNPFADDERVEHVEGDRTDEKRLREAAAAAEYDLVFDFVAYHPGEVRTATDVFADADAYVYVSSASAYDPRPFDLPFRAGVTPLHDCTPEQATDDSHGTYGARKAEGDRVVFEAAAEGVNAVSVRPGLVYGPHDPTGRFDYWVHRVADHDRVVVPGDGDCVLHRSYVADLARGLVLAAEEGTPGVAYDAADAGTPTLAATVDLLADALDTDAEAVLADERALADAGLAPGDFPLYTPRPFLVDTTPLDALGWEHTPVPEAVAATAGHVRETGQGGDAGPDRAAEERVLAALED